MHNSITLVGRVGRDAESRTTQFGTVANFSIATSESWRDKSTGERKERTQWHRIVIFNEPIAKIAEQYVRKGGLVLIEGALEYRDYEDKDGVKRQVAEIVLRPFAGTLRLMGDSKAGARNPDEYGTVSTKPGGSSSTPTPHQPAPIDDDIPF